MKFRRLGMSNLRVSVIGLGTYQFSGSWGKSFTRQDAGRIVGAAHECGINLIDTAECYGADHLAERLIGHALARSRQHWIIATKFGHHRSDRTHRTEAWDPVAVKQQLNDSLKALGTDYVDLYQFHSGSNDVFDNDDLWLMLDKQRQAGKIRHLGISVARGSGNQDIHQIKRASDVGVSVIQVKYNRLERDAETGALPECLAQDLGVLARVPLASGLLSGRYQDLVSFDPTDVRAEKYNSQLIAKMQGEIRQILSTELPENASLVEYALAWSLSHPAVCCVITGCKTPQHIQQNAAVANSKMLHRSHPRDIE